MAGCITTTTFPGSVRRPRARDNHGLGRDSAHIQWDSFDGWASGHLHGSLVTHAFYEAAGKEAQPDCREGGDRERQMGRWRCLWDRDLEFPPPPPRYRFPVLCFRATTIRAWASERFDAIVDFEFCRADYQFLEPRGIPVDGIGSLPDNDGSLLRRTCVRTKMRDRRTL